MKEGLINDVYEAVAKELQLLLSISYLIMIGIGMLFNNQRYSEFGINIFQYADIFDFLIAPFEDWRIISFALTSLLIPLAVVIFDKLWRENLQNRTRLPILNGTKNVGIILCEQYPSEVYSYSLQSKLQMTTERNRRVEF